MLRLLLFNALLFGVWAYALWRGRTDEKLIASVCVIASLATFALAAPVDLRYSTLEFGVLAVDLLVLGVFIHVALRSDRFWPLWVSGLQLTTSIAHLLKAVQPELLPIAYAMAGRFWSYPILLILAIGTWRTHQRARSERDFVLP